VCSVPFCDCDTLQRCKVGTVVGNQKLFGLPPCQAFFQIKKETQWQFEIHTNDDIFMEYVTVQPSNFSSTCKMTSYSEKTQILNGECP
jgi:hypothetical protein